MIKIAISGQLRTGKNTLAQMIADNLTSNTNDYKIVAVADPIKNMVMKMIPNADPQCLWGESELRSKIIPGNLKDLNGEPLTYRRVLMDIGGLGRKYNPDIWLNALVEGSKNNKNTKIYIIADVRFVNEINYLKEHGFYMIRIKRQGMPQIDDVSETAQLSIPDSFFNYVIENNGSLFDLNEQAKLVSNKLV